MSDQKTATPRVSIRAWLEPQTQTARDLPAAFVVFGPNGDGPNTYGQKPIQLTKQNIGTHAGLVTVLRNIAVKYRLPWAPEEERTLVIPALRLRGHTRTWPRQIVDAVEDLKRLELTAEAFREAKNNLRIREAVRAWLTAGDGVDPAAN
jgi:hypothetical protein